MESETSQEEHFGYYLLRIVIWLGIFIFAIGGLKSYLHIFKLNFFNGDYIEFSYIGIMLVTSVLFLRDLPHVRLEFQKLGSPIHQEGEGLMEVKK
jgi:hypothetical protein